jgi:hypothetical protein
MSASDDLSKLSDRAAQAEKNVEAAKGKGQAALKAQADAARKSAAAQASSLEKDTTAAGDVAKAKAAGLEAKSSDSRRLSRLALTLSRRAPRQTTRRPHKARPRPSRDRSMLAPVALGLALTAAAHCFVLVLLGARQHDPGVMGLITPGERDLFASSRQSPARGSANGPHWLMSPGEPWSTLA